MSRHKLCWSIRELFSQPFFITQNFNFVSYVKKFSTQLCQKVSESVRTSLFCKGVPSRKSAAQEEMTEKSSSCQNACLPLLIINTCPVFFLSTDVRIQNLFVFSLENKEGFVRTPTMISGLHVRAKPSALCSWVPAKSWSPCCLVKC